MKKALIVIAVLFLLISPVFILRYFNLKKIIIQSSKGVEQFQNESFTDNLSSWAVINGYASIFSLMIGIILIFAVIKRAAGIKTTN